MTFHYNGLFLIKKIFFTRFDFTAIRCAIAPVARSEHMATDKAEIELDDDFVTDDAEDAEAEVEVAKTNLTKRRIIDNYLEERRLQKDIADYDFDI